MDVTQAAISLGGVLLSALLGAALGRQAGRGDAARETALPPPPQTSQPSLPTIAHGCEVTREEHEALRERVGGLEAREREALQQVAAMKERIRIARENRSGGDRGSST